MPGSSNFLQFNPTAANQETDTAYSSDTLRSGGAANSALLPSPLFNKLMFQVSTMVAGLGQALANKGFTISDANLATLTSAVQNIMTTADMSPYALLNGPNFTNPTTGSTPASGQANSAMPNTYWVDLYFAKLSYVQATFLTIASAAATYATSSYVNGTFVPINSGTLNTPTINNATLVNPFTNSTPAAGDATGKMPNTAWVSAYYASLSYLNSTFAPLASPALSGTPTAPTPATADNTTKIATTAFVKNQNYQANLGFAPVQQGGGIGQSPNKVYIGWDGGVRVTVDSTDLGRLALMSYSPASFGTYTGWSRMANGQLICWGNVGTDNTYGAGGILTTYYPVAFATAPAVSITSCNGGIASDSIVFNVTGLNGSYFQWAGSQSGIHAMFWIAIGS